MPNIYIVHSDAKWAVPPVEAFPVFHAAMEHINSVCRDFTAGLASDEMELRPVHYDAEKNDGLRYSLEMTYLKHGEKITLSIYESHLIFDVDDGGHDAAAQ